MSRTPTHPDPVSTNQPNVPAMNREGNSTDERTGTEGMPGNFPRSPKDSTSSGGWGASPSQVWSNKAQRGTDTTQPTKTPTVSERAGGNKQSTNDMGLIDQTSNGIDLKDEFDDARFGADPEVRTPSMGVWGVETGAGKDYGKED